MDQGSSALRIARSDRGVIASSSLDQAGIRGATLACRIRCTHSGALSRDSAPECVHRIRHAKVAPRMPAWSSELDAITPRSERAIRNALEPWSIKTQKRIDLRRPTSFGQKMTNAAQVSFTFFADRPHKQQRTGERYLLVRSEE